MDLENKMAAMQEELSNAPVRKVTSSVDWIPRPPERWTLTGHRSPITRVAFHPVFSLIASASEDTTIRVYDYETGEYERTLKGHTKAVQDLAFDAKGNLLGEHASFLEVQMILSLMYSSFISPSFSFSFFDSVVLKRSEH